jgi:hypothetical protein
MWFLLGVYFFQRKHRTTDGVYKAVYTLTAVGAFALGCSGLLNTFLKDYAVEHGFYILLNLVKTLLIGFFIGVFILWGFVEHKLRRDYKKT